MEYVMCKYKQIFYKSLYLFYKNIINRVRAPCLLLIERKHFKNKNRV